MSMKRLVLAGILAATALAFVVVSPTAVMADEVKGASIAVTDEGSWIEFKGAPDPKCLKRLKWQPKLRDKQCAGAMVKSKISSSRTKLTIGGKEDKRTNLKSDMTCDITYVMEGEKNEPSVVSCM